jgi:hypothetical protein
MDNLEQFIKKNREAFDLKPPPEHLWSAISQQLDAGSPKETTAPALKVRTAAWRQYLRPAAAAVILLTAGFAIGTFLARRNAPAHTLAAVYPEYAEVEKYYQRQISNGISRLAGLQERALVQQDLQKLDTLYQQLLSDLQTAPPQAASRIVEAMINNYKTRIEILEQVQRSVDASKSLHQKSNNNEISL